MLTTSRSRGIRLIVPLSLVVSLGRPVHGQSAMAASSEAGPGHGLAGAGFVLAADDAAERIRFRGPTVGGLWLVDAAVFVGGRVGVGVEALALGTVTGSYEAACCRISDEEKETAVFASGRWRAFHRNRIAIDAVAGVGRVFQHRDTRTSLRFPTSETVVTEDRRSPAFALGIDAPMSLVPHIAISPLARVYFLDRGVRSTPNVLFVSSTRVVLGFTAGVTW
jgi:hypothetical protein